jgi:hypothetical protein
MRIRAVLGLVGAAALAAGCATGFVDTWQSPGWSGPPLRNVLVVGNAHDGLARRAYEDAMSARLAKIGVRADPSYRVLSEERLEREAVASAVAAGGHDGLVTARLVGVSQRARYVPAGPPGPWIGWRAWGGFYEPGYVDVDQVARIETQVWSAAGEGTMIWAGVSEAVNPRDLSKVADSLAEATAAALQKAGVLPE